MKSGIGLIIIFIWSCKPATTADNKNQNDTLVETLKSTEFAAISLTGCYLSVQNRDSILLELHLTDSAVKGRMQYDNFEIDGNIGTITATLRNNRIEGYFHFLSEGSWSVRQIIFKPHNDYLQQADTRQMIYTNDTASFKGDPLWDTVRVFKPVDCSSLHFSPLPH